MKIELSVIIVNYNGLKYLKECLDSLSQKLNGVDYEIIILDNNSIDESCNFIKKNYSQIILIESKINYGFGKGNNEAVKMAKGNYLLLLNNDTIILNNLKPALDLIKSDKTIGVLGINMLNANKQYLPAAGNFPNFRNMFQFVKLLNLGTEFKKGIFSKQYYEVDWLCGSFLLLLKKTYIKTNGFDENYFMYVEDVDFCKKISKIGLKRIFMPTLSYIHFVGFNPLKNLMLVKGYKIYIEKHFFGINKTIVSFILLLNSLVKKLKLSFKTD